MRVEFVPGLRRRPKKKTIDHEDKRISENTLNPLRFFSLVMSTLVQASSPMTVAVIVLLKLPNSRGG
jgi:hypothetical protein